MTCRAATSKIPLFVGGELPASKSENVRRHIAACPECRAEADEIARARLAVRDLARAEETGDWSPDAWRRVISAVTGTGIRPKTDWAGARLRPLLAGGLGSLVLAAGLLYIIRSSRLVEAPVAAMKTESERAMIELFPPAPKADPDVTSVTLVSPETGLKIIWFYNRKFEWQGFGK